MGLGEPAWRTERVELIILIAAWYSTSCVAITTSKLCMQFVSVPLVLCTTQFLTAALVTRAYMLLTRGLSRHVRAGELRSVCSIAGAYAFGFLTTNLAFALATPSFVETIKAGEPVTTALLAAALLGERERAATYGALAPIVVGIATATGADAQGAIFSFATLVVLFSNLCFSFRAVFVKRLKRVHPQSSSGRSAVVLFYHVSRYGFPGFLAAAWLHGDFAALAHNVQPPHFFAALAANGLAYSTYNLASFMVLNRVSTTTHAVLNVFRRVVVIAITSVYFVTPLSLVGSAGIALAAFGVFAYARSKE